MTFIHSFVTSVLADVLPIYHRIPAESAAVQTLTGDRVEVVENSIVSQDLSLSDANEFS